MAMSASARGKKRRALRMRRRWVRVPASSGAREGTLSMRATQRVETCAICDARRAVTQAEWEVGMRAVGRSRRK